MKSLPSLSLSESRKGLKLKNVSFEHQRKAANSPKVTCNSHCDHEIGRGDESVGGGVGVVTASKVAVVRGHNRVWLALLDVRPIPLAVKEVSISFYSIEKKM